MVRSNAQPEVQPTQVPTANPAEMPNFSVPPPPVNADLHHQQAEINRLMQVAEGLYQYNQPHHTTIRMGLAQIQAGVDPLIPAVLQIDHQSHTIEHPADLMS